MARLGGFFVCLLIVAMDIVGGIMGIEAELEQNKVKHLRRWIFECREPSHAAFKLGLAAAGLLVAAHVVANLLGGCNCICSQEELQKAPPNKQLSDHFWCWIGRAGDWDLVKPQVKSFMWLHTP
ncbi:PREDICTED: transmembrane [Prunus dulcis]|nr:PREDICTED: transmembrane [Prunus dulcis]